MSASPSGLSNGQTPTPKEGQAQFVRKPKVADPLRPRKKPVRRQNLQPIPQDPSRPAPFSNGPPQNAAKAPPQNRPNGFAPPQPRQIPINGAATPGGWSHTPPPGSYRDFPLVTTKRALRDGLRYHIARFAGKREVDPSDQEQFTRPVVLHRRDPRQPPPGKGVKEEDSMALDPVDSKEQDRLDALKAEKDKRRAEDLKQIAPTGNNAAAQAAKKTQAFRNEKTTQVHRLDKTEEEKKASDLRYEEALPWHVEDADNKNTWVGNYEAALSETNVIFVIDGNSFKMIPVEKWYKFTAKSTFKTFTIEEAEAQLGKKVKESRWVMQTKEKNKAAEDIQEMKKGLAMFTVKSESSTARGARKGETLDMDTLDFDGDDLFQDDDEQATFEPEKDEDTKEAQDRIKREQLGANTFGEADEADIEKEFAKEEEEEQKRKKFGKDVKKALKKRERNLIYDSDSDHPYSESSDDDTSDEEKQAEIDRKKDEEAKNKAKESKGEVKTEVKVESKLPSGASSKGTNTPSGRPKHRDALKKSTKRPNSPEHSESSGNESTRKSKKHKSHHSSRPTNTSTPISGSRQASPVPTGNQPSQSPRKVSIIKLNVSSNKLSEISSAPPNPSPTYSGPMSDGEATGGEMSDGGKKKKIKLRLGGGSPNGSRAGSPAPIGGRAGSTGAGGSRAGSPAVQGQSSATAARAGSPSLGAIQPQEIRSALPASGVSIAGLLKVFSARIGGDGQIEKKAFIKLVMENSRYGPDKLLRPK